MHSAHLLCSVWRTALVDQFCISKSCDGVPCQAFSSSTARGIPVLLQCASLWEGALDCSNSRQITRRGLHTRQYRQPIQRCILAPRTLLDRRLYSTLTCLCMVQSSRAHLSLALPLASLSYHCASDSLGQACVRLSLSHIDWAIIAACASSHIRVFLAWVTESLWPKLTWTYIRRKLLSSSFWALLSSEPCSSRRRLWRFWT